MANPYYNSDPRDVLPIMSASSQPIPTALVVPIIEGYVQGIRPAFAFILIPAVFGSMLLPLLILLFALSTAQTRRRPIFILNVLAVGLGIIVAGLSAHLTVCPHPTRVSRTLTAL